MFRYQWLLLRPLASIRLNYEILRTLPVAQYMPSDKMYGARELGHMIRSTVTHAVEDSNGEEMVLILVPAAAMTTDVHGSRSRDVDSFSRKRPTI